jgi:hypothetical protein
MLIGVLKILNLSHFQIFHYSPLVLCWLSTSIYFGPLHWLSKRQIVTAGSSAEAEIYASDECVKFLLELVQILEFLEVKQLFMPGINKISMTIKHVSIGQNHVLLRDCAIYK